MPMLMDHPVIQRIAKKYNEPTGRVLLRWATQRYRWEQKLGVLPDANFLIVRGIAVIPKSNNMARLQQNLGVNSFSMTEDDLVEITALDKGLRFNDPGFYLEKPLRIFD